MRRKIERNPRTGETSRARDGDMLRIADRAGADLETAALDRPTRRAVGREDATIGALAPIPPPGAVCPFIPASTIRETGAVLLAWSYIAPFLAVAPFFQAPPLWVIAMMWPRS